MFFSEKTAILINFHASEKMGGCIGTVQVFEIADLYSLLSLLQKLVHTDAQWDTWTDAQMVGNSMSLLWALQAWGDKK